MEHKSIQNASAAAVLSVDSFMDDLEPVVLRKNETEFGIKS